MQSNSPRFSLNLIDWHKALSWLLKGVVSAIVVVLTQMEGMNYVVTVKGTTFDATPLVVLVLTFLVDLGNRYLSDYTKTV